MSAPQPNHEDLEKRIHAALRSLPDRSAPESLERRVLAEISRRAALPWWQQSYAHWPHPIRLAFLVLSAAIAALAIAVGVEFLHGAGAEAVAHGTSRLHALYTAVNSVADVFARMIPPIPRFWLYASVAVFIAGYAALISAGTAAYRFFSRHR